MQIRSELSPSHIVSEGNSFSDANTIACMEGFKRSSEQLCHRGDVYTPDVLELMERDCHFQSTR